MTTATNSGVYEVDCLLADPSNRWNTLAPFGSAATVTYSFPTALPSYYASGSISDFHAFDEAWKQAARDALAQYSQIANLTFVEVPDATGGQIRFAFDSQESGGYAYYPTGTLAGQYDVGGDVWVRSDYASAAPTNYGQLLLHEIGHALGMKHPGSYNTYASNADDSGPFLPSAEDNTNYTVMSYNYGSVTQVGLAPLDKQAIQFLYGAKTPTNIGNLHYGDASANGMSGDSGSNYLHGLAGDDTIHGWGGNDQLAGEEGNDWLLGDDGNDLIASNTGRDLVEGGAGNDTLYGGQDEDTISGGTGNDLMYGNLGADSIVADDGDDTVYAGQGNDTIWGSAGNDNLYGNLGDDVLYGGSGWCIMNGNAGNDTLVGSSGTTYFRFDANSGNDVVSHFTKGRDYIIVSKDLGFSSGSDLYARTSDGASGAVVDLGGGNTITMLGLSKADLASWTFAIW